MTTVKLVELKGEELPRNWMASTLGEVASYIQRGKSPKYTEYSELPVVNQKCVRWHGIDREYVKYIHPDQFEKWEEKRFLQNGDLLWNSTGTGTIGRAAIVQLKDGERLVADSHVTIVRSAEGMNPKYVHYWVMGPGVQNSIEAMQSGSTNQVELSKGAVESTPIPVAPPEQQKRIVAKIEELFSHIDAGIEALNKAKKLLKQYRQSVLKAAVTGELTKEWREDNKDKLEPASQLLERILQERRQKWEARQLEQFKAKGKVPKDDVWKGKYKEPDELEVIPSEALPVTWQWAALGQVFEVFVGATPSRKKLEYWGGDINWVSSGEVAFCRIKDTKEKITEEGLNNTSTALHPPGTVMLGMIGEGKTRGQAAILDIYAAHNQNTSAIEKCVEEQSTEFLYFYLMQQYELTRKRGSGNNQKALNKTRVQAIEFPLAPTAEQKIISELLSEKFTSIEKLEGAIEIQLRKAEKNKQSILASAFIGELVEALDSDGSAQDLLEEIRRQHVLNAAKETLTKNQRPSKKKAALMSKRKIIDVLKVSGQALSPEKLFDLIGADGSSPDEVEEFYIELKATLADKNVVIEPVLDANVKKGDLISYKVEA